MDRELVRAATYIHAPYELVWRTLTRPEYHDRWHVAPCLAFGTEAGDRVAWGVDEESEIEGTLFRWEPATGFAHSFAFTKLGEPASVVEWQVQPLGELVWVEIKHDFPEEALETQAIITDGWTLVLARLKTLLEVGEPMPWPEWDDEERAPW
ncbi:MAG: SRPBCC domain-containing protein [Anaerolineales bacterium]|nr:SRPBCC domain-containing protein [Anaerolineales bacterium]MCB9126381.1 SRPBCC domain-containing protein [Ardenticatenales bacterium]MCB9171542.1 SRPBCC domain-containing protein [Ardenticatenales bacterium]